MPEKLDLSEINDRLVKYEGWAQQGPYLTKQYQFEDFAAALAFVNAVGAVAEELNHHPDIAVQDYNTVILEITTHEVNGITELDFEFVDRVEQEAEQHGR